MQPSMSLEGSSTVVRNLNSALKNVDLSCKGAMHAALLMVRRAATPLTPVDTGDLRRSVGTRVISQGHCGYTGLIYYTSDYAPYVHEINKRYRAPGTQWKFLETALQRESNNILRLFGSKLQMHNMVRSASGGAGSDTTPGETFEGGAGI